MVNDRMIECKCFSWKPVFAGALTIIGFSFLLNLFSVAIGLTAFTTNSEGVENLAIGGLMAMALGIIVSMFASGWITGYMANRYCTKRHTGVLYGFLAWCLALIITVFLADTLVKYVTFYVHFISGTPVTEPVTRAAAALADNPPRDNPLVISTYIVFCLFFLSAFSCSLGGHCGMRYKDREVH